MWFSEGPGSSSSARREQSTVVDGELHGEEVVAIEVGLSAMVTVGLSSKLVLCDEGKTTVHFGGLVGNETAWR
jgi:hypothetical protein